MDQGYRERQREYGEKAAAEKKCDIDGCEQMVSKTKYPKHLLEEHTG